MSEFVNTVDIIGDNALSDSLIARSITEYSDDSITFIGASAFRTCSQLASVEFPAVTSISASAFRDCSQLTALILRNTETLATLANANALNNTPIKSGTGYIYVPRTMADGSDGVEAYKAATNWSTYATKFRALENYTVDGTITGELDPNKI